jgi:anthranilate synthase component 1
MADNFSYQTITSVMLADTYTPVSIYLKLRDVYPEAVLLESTDYRAADNSFSYLCFNPLSEFICAGKSLSIKTVGKRNTTKQITNSKALFESFDDFRLSFKEVNGNNSIANGLFGYLTFEAVNLFQKIPEFKPGNDEIPLMRFAFYRFVIAFNHFKDELILHENIPGDEKSQMPELLSAIQNKNVPSFPFDTSGEEKSSSTDPEFIEMVKKGIAHCYRGDVFQVVLSRRFIRKYIGDDMNLYRSLRSINPSPYLFYFDYGSFRIFGSSPEAQLVVKNGLAKINPIAGTFRRTGNDEADKMLAAKLAADEKENAEHVMLVDLARNDLSKNASEVSVSSYKQVHYYSHVIHLVSEVTGRVEKNTNPLQLIANSFPAGTLSGAPKHRAIQLIQEYEKHARGFYGGCIGFIGFNGDINTAITIRSFMSHNNMLHYQAGAGIVAASVPESELEEVNNKLRALRTAIESAKRLT